jgi:hypothetical protein
MYDITYDRRHRTLRPHSGDADAYLRRVFNLPRYRDRDLTGDDMRLIAHIAKLRGFQVNDA